ncbi:LysR family transcriptional regulator [Kitasatospora gansuensis]
MSEAAAALGINQSALVTQISRLERDLGHPLFERAERGRPMRLTPVGEEVATAARRLRRRVPIPRNESCRTGKAQSAHA